MAIIVNDTFTESGGGTLTLASHVPAPTGTAWTREAASTAGRNLQVKATTDTVNADGAGAGSTIYTVTPAPSVAEYDVSFTVIALDTSNNPYSIGLLARFVDSNNYLFARILPSLQSADKTLYKRVSGTTTLMSGGSGDAANAANDVIKFEVRNGTKTLYQNGVSRCSTTEDPIASAGKAGLIWGGVAGDSTINTWEIDTFQVDEAAAVTPKSLLWLPAPLRALIGR